MPVPAIATNETRFNRYSDLLVAVAVIGSVMLMVIKLPPIFLDFSLVFNITFSLVILLVSLFTLHPLEFSVFPSLLLIMTLLRLSLNVASTRLILSEASAGNVIKAFGDFVIGGNPVVGFIMFLILVVIQFIVITKGAERVSEVAARFTLDAMPGKQMSIDADLNAGLIDDQQARQRRENIQRQADFYGAMDGATKFVKGDAIAGIVIVLINIIGGFVIGIVQKNMEFGTALHTYTILTVGDGLVTQIPALLISTAAGIVVTRSTSESHLGQALLTQMFARPQILIIAALALVTLGFIGLPALPLYVMAGLLSVLSLGLQRNLKKTVVQEAEKEKEHEIEEIKKPENVISLLQVDTMELEMGYSLIPLVDTHQGGDLLDRVVMIRRQCALELGLVVPPVRIRDNMQLKPNVYIIKIRGVQVAQGEVMIDHYLAMSPGIEDPEIQGIDTREPAFGLPAKWITPAMRERAELSGYTVVDPPSVIATHLTEIIKSHAHEILGRQDVQTLLDHVKQNYPAVVNDLVPELLSVGEIQKVLGNLLQERVPIRDLVTILETLADYARLTKDLDVLTEYVRQALRRYICKQYVREDNTLPVITLDPALEQLIRDSLQTSDYGTFIALEPQQAQNLIQQISKLAEQAVQHGYQPIVLSAPVVRLYLKRLVERVLPNLIILSYNELDNQVEVQASGMVTL
ncbi:MAG: flagellar biosynthesis protein FlhA [Syntrophomonadaceae bacterium]|nr:flagellar biosynthesis protein FlhA [Syntrophomonadaceae bacterium]